MQIFEGEIGKRAEIIRVLSSPTWIFFYNDKYNKVPYENWNVVITEKVA